MANYIGMNYNLDGVCFDCLDGTTIMAFKDDVVQFFTNEVLTSTASRVAMFPEVGTSQITYVYRNGVSTVPNQFYQIYFFNNAGDYWRYEVSTPHTTPTTYTFLQTGSHPWKVNRGPMGANNDLYFKNDNGVMKVDQLGNTGNFQPYGPGNTLYPTLPNTQIPDACWNNTVDGYVYISIVDTIYKLDAVNAVMVSFAKYNVPPGPVTPPTPLPDIEVVYSAPSQFNLFSNNVALVTETQYGWNFTKTILTADKMELYLYHSSAPGAIAFNYNQLRDIQVNMKNNLALPTGEIFMTVWTGPPVAPNWYNYKDIYNMTPALGTTVDIDLVLTTLNLTDARTDPILAIALHSNSSQQQVNCDVEKVSFDILLPANNNSQRVIVKLQNNFIVVDDKYWDLENSAIAKQGTTILPGFQIDTFTPNIIAGNYPQSGTAKEVASGAAWYLKGTYTEWAQTSANVWAPSGNTIEFTSNFVNAGVDTNGAAYIGCLGGVALTGTWNPQPFTWEISPSNQLIILNTNGSTVIFSPLVDLPQPNNFTAVQAESGCFSSSYVGTLDTTALISNSVASFKSPIFPTEIDLTFLSESQVIIRRSWEIVDTTYTIASSKVLSGQYISPTYPNNGNLNLPPDSYTMSNDWIVLAENNTQFEILFSGGLNNSLPAESQNFRQMTVTPTPTDTEITFTWTANYYNAGNILISAVAGITTTGLVSSFTTGGSLKPANAAYILYGCTSSQNIDAFASLVFIEPEADPVINLSFQSANNQILTDGTYTVTPSPAQTVQYDAVFRDLAGGSLGAVPGFGTSGTSSSFTITYATLPATVAWIDYQCTDGTSTAQLSITIVPQAIESFVLTFQNPTNQIDANGIFSVSPIALDPQSTYAYTAVYMVDNTVLGPVTGAGASGTSSAFSIDFATAPATSTWINYNCTATGGTQDGETSQLSITLIHPTPPAPPQPGPGGDVQIYKTIEGNIFQSQHNPRQAMKMSVADKINMLELSIVDSQNNLMNSQNNIYYEIENIIHDSNMIN